MPAQLLTNAGCAEAHSCSLPQSSAAQAVRECGINDPILLDCPHGTARCWQWKNDSKWLNWNHWERKQAQAVDLSQTKCCSSRQLYEADRAVCELRALVSRTPSDGPKGVWPREGRLFMLQQLSGHFGVVYWALLGMVKPHCGHCYVHCQWSPATETGCQPPTAP
jgi:hypothetical protein